MAELTFERLREINVHRCEHGFGHSLKSWSVAEWGNAMQGEGGEAAEAFIEFMTYMIQQYTWGTAVWAAAGNAGNTAKKLLRFRDGVAGNTKPEEEYRRQLAREVAGMVIYADLWLAGSGISLAEAIRDEFNSKSVEIGYQGERL